MEKYESLCVQLHSGNSEEILQAQTQINDLFEALPVTELVDFLIYEIEKESSVYSKFTSMIILSQTDLNELDLKKVLPTLFTIFSDDNISLRNSAIQLFSKFLINIININKKDDDNDICFMIVNQLTEQISNSNSIEICLSINCVLFQLLDYYQDEMEISTYICTYLFQQMIEISQNHEDINNNLIQLFSDHISFLFKMFLTEEQAMSLFTFIKTLLENDQFKKSLYLFILKITEFDHKLLEPIIDTFFEISINDLGCQNDDSDMMLTILNIWYSIFKKEKNRRLIQSTFHSVFEGIEILIKIIENKKIKEMRFKTEWNESIACFKCLKYYSKIKNSLTTEFFMNYLNEKDFNEMSLLLTEIIITSSSHDFVIENISEFIKLINQGFQVISQEGIESDLIVFIQFSSIKCLRKMVKYFPECLSLFFQFVELIIPFIENEETLALEALETLSLIFCISPYQEKEKYINLIFENSKNLPPFISSHSIDSLLPIISTIEESNFFIEAVPTVLNLISEVKDETCADSLLYFLQRFVLCAGESISPFIQTIISMLLQLIVENHSIVSILAVGSISSVSPAELIEPFIDDIFSILSEVILNDGMDDKSVRNQCLSSLSLIAYPFNLSAYLDQIYELTIKILQNIESNEWNDFDFTSAAFLIDLYVPLIMNQIEIDESIMSNIFNVILHQISLIDFDTDDEYSQFSEISRFLEISTKFIIQIFRNCENLLSDDVFNLAFVLIENATQLPLMDLSIKETIYDLYELLSKKFPSQLCTVFYQNQKVESFILNLFSSSEFMTILSNKALKVQQK